MFIFQDDNIQIHQTQIVKKSFVHMNPEFKISENVWDVVKETLQSSGLLP